MEFFLDTGPIFAYSNPYNKPHHAHCREFFNKYTFDSNYFCTAKELIRIELDNIRRKRSEFDQHQTARSIERQLEYLLDEIIHDVDYKDNKMFDQIFTGIYHLLEINKIDQNPKERDAKLLSHAFIWDNQNSHLRNPCFLTIDGADIGWNREEIKEEVRTCFECRIKLMILTVKEMIESGL